MSKASHWLYRFSKNNEHLREVSKGLRKGVSDGLAREGWVVGELSAHLFRMHVWGVYPLCHAGSWLWADQKLQCQRVGGGTAACVLTGKILDWSGLR